MALVTDYGRWQYYCQSQCIPRKAWSAPRMPLIQMSVTCCCCERGPRVVRGSSRSRVGRSRPSQYLNTSPRNGFNLLSGRRVGNRYSEISSSGEISEEGQKEEQRPAFNLDLAVILAGFAFESYNTPPKNVGVREMDGGRCETVYLTREFVQSIYDGQLFVNLKRGADFPGLNLWGNSDPYVLFRIGDNSVQSKTVWGSTDPVWNENLTMNMKSSAGLDLQVAAWDANVVASHNRLGNASVTLKNICDGERHNLELRLEGMGGGGRLFFEVNFKTFAQIEAEKSPFSLAGEIIGSAYKSIFGGLGISVGEFMSDFQSVQIKELDLSTSSDSSFKPRDDADPSGEDDSLRLQITGGGVSGTNLPQPQKKSTESKALENETLDKPKGQQGNEGLPAGNQVLEGLMKDTEGIVGAWAMSNKSLRGNPRGGQDRSKSRQPANVVTPTNSAIQSEEVDGNNDKSSAIGSERTKSTTFSTAESAMEAWALLATTMGGTSLVKSDFEKFCFVENERTDTQAAIWRDLKRQRLVVAFRGTEQTKWKDVVTDMSLFATGFNPERVAGGSGLKDEALVHGGFLKAYDSVKRRLLSLVRVSTDCSNQSQDELSWHIYVTGHSLGGALATLFALELSSSKLAKEHHVQISMYNYGSPRLGNRLFANNYNKIVKDSWRIVNYRDIVPTVPRLMGYCHVAQPIYLTADSSHMVQTDLLDDGYQGDIIGEVTPDIIFTKLMRGEQKLLDRLLDTEIAMLQAMRDGSALMQHMEDFYYTTLLKRSRIVARKIDDDLSSSENGTTITPPPCPVI